MTFVQDIHPNYESALIGVLSEYGISHITEFHSKRECVTFLIECEPSQLFDIVFDLVIQCRFKPTVNEKSTELFKVDSVVRIPYFPEDER